MLNENDFLTFYPQFTIFAQGVVLSEYIRQANARFSDFEDDAEEARRLFVAHRLTMYAMSCAAAGPEATMEMIAAAGKGSQNRIASKKVGEVTVSYSNSSAVSGGGFGLQDLNETVYGLQLISLLKIYGFGRYIP